MTQCYHWLRQSKYLAPLSNACKMCAQGSKMVVLITGLCPAHCFYCPLSRRKQQKDVIFADEWQLTNEMEVETLFKEAKAIDATGAGITGGDPLMVPRRTIQYIKLLKQWFGTDFHIHLYTSGLKNTEYIKDMIKNGLDEIRFHPEPRFWNQMKKNPLETVITGTVSLVVDTAIEIPVLPNRTQEIIHLINWADAKKIDFINLNELEFSECNETALYNKGYTMKNDISAAATDSQTTAEEILDFFEDHPVNIGIHYCSSSFKDGVQLSNRMKRRAKNIARSFDVITYEGTIIKGIIEPSTKISLSQIKTILQKKIKLPSHNYAINQKKQRIELHPETLKELLSILSSLHLKCFLIEEYPTADYLEVERIPL